MTAATKYVIRKAEKADGDAMLALLPRLADFDLPAARTAEHLWIHDAAYLREWLEDKAEDCQVHVAADTAGVIVGIAMVTLRPELLSHEPSAHLEALAVANGVEGQGIGQRLLQAAEKEARAKGAKSMTLHVFAVNARARGLYEKSGYDGELMRYTKPIDQQREKPTRV